MAETYLNGKITLSSLAAPTAEDIEKVHALSADDHRALIHEALDKGRNSPIGNRTVDEIWDSALQKAAEIKAKQQHAL